LDPRDDATPPPECGSAERRGGKGTPTARATSVQHGVLAGQILFVEVFHPLEVLRQGLFHRHGQDGDVVPLPFVIAHDDLALFEIQVLDPQAQAFHEAQAAAVEELCHQQVDAGELRQHALHFAAGENGAQTVWLFGAHRVDGEIQVLSEDLAVKEQQRTERLVLGGGGNVFFHRQVGKESYDFRCSNLFG